MSVDFEIIPDPADSRNTAELMEIIDNALRNSGSALRSGPSGFLLDGATLQVLDRSKALELAPASQAQAPSPAQVQSFAAEPGRSFPSQPGMLPSQPISAPPEQPGPSVDQLLARVAELGSTVELLKGELEQTQVEKGDLLKRLSESENALLLKMKELDAVVVERDEAKKESFYAKEEMADAKKNLAQAKEMWMKESARATKLRDQLDKAELQVADLQKLIEKNAASSKKTETENQNLKHLLSKSNEIVSTQVLTPQTVENSFPASDSYFVRGGTVANLRNPLFTNASMAPSPLGGSVGKAAASFSTPPVTPRAASQTSSKFLHLCVMNDGVLYEDEILQIGVKAKFTGLGEGVMGVYYGNKTSGILQNFQVKYTLDTCGENLHLTASPMPSQVGPKSQLCQRVAAQISGPFTDSPRLVVSFLLPDNTPRSIPLRFPVVISKYMQARELGVEEFFSNWRMQTFVLNEASSVVNVTLNLAQIARAAQLGGALHLHHQIDEVPDNLVLVGQFPSDSPEGIRCATIPEALVLTRIEVGAGPNAGKARIAVRSNDAVVAEAVRAALAQQLTL